jgi:drug/metabolite transporter (DMT)-like permease
MTDTHEAATPAVAVDRTQTFGLASLMIVLATWSLGPVLSARVTSHPLVSAAFRMTIAAIFQWVLVLVLRKAPSRALLKRSMLPGALFCLNNILFFGALQRASVANATMLVSLQPVVVMLIARQLFGEVVRRWDVAWTGVALAGAAYAILGSNAGGKTRPTTPLGATLAIGSMLAFSVYFLLAKRENSHPDRVPPNPLTYMTAIVTCSAVTSWPFLVLGGKVDAAWHITGKQVNALLLVATIPTIGHLFMTYAHRHIDASVSALVLLSQPITTALAAWWLIGQRVVAAQFIGGFVVIASVAMVTIRKRALARAGLAAATEALTVGV